MRARSLVVALLVTALLGEGASTAVASPGPAPAVVPGGIGTSVAAVGPLRVVVLPTLRVGSRGSAVVSMQKRLRVHGATITADGIFGTRTKAAVVSFQRAKKLTADGIVGVRTWAALNKAPAAKLPAKPSGSIVSQTNWYRAKAGCPALTVDRRLNSSASKHAKDMDTYEYFAHTSRTGKTFQQRIRAAGYPYPAAENLARGQTSVTQVMHDLMASKSHRANILNCGIKRIGTARSGVYWAQDYGW